MQAMEEYRNTIVHFDISGSLRLCSCKLSGTTGESETLCRTEIVKEQDEDIFKTRMQIINCFHQGDSDTDLKQLVKGLEKNVSLIQEAERAVTIKGQFDINSQRYSLQCNGQGQLEIN